MSRLGAAVGSLVFLVVAPGTVAGAVPWWLTGWRPRWHWLPAELAGGLLIVAGTAVLLIAFAAFVIEGIGTPAPIAPTQHLVVRGFYAHVRNPMYVAVGAVIAGEAIALGQPILLGYLGVFAVVVASFVIGYEEPTLLEKYGEEYVRYREAVPRWVPRLTTRSIRER